MIYIFIEKHNTIAYFVEANTIEEAKSKKLYDDYKSFDTFSYSLKSHILKEFKDKYNIVVLDKFDANGISKISLCVNFYECNNDCELEICELEIYED